MGTESVATRDEDRHLIDTAVDRLLEEHPPADTDGVTFLRAQFDAGLAYIWYPRGHGGLGQPVNAQQRVEERLTAAGARPSGRVTNAIAAGQGSASILAYGSDDQKNRYLRPLFTAELTGCQLYSEPRIGIGSGLFVHPGRAARRRADRERAEGLDLGRAPSPTWRYFSPGPIRVFRSTPVSRSSC
jgi:alkylation response protein AidB-like acyl-CoA dehydrogenase